MLFNRPLLITILAISHFRKGQSALAEGDNASPYGLLCNIYNIAASPPTSLYDPEQVKAIRKQVDIINASLSDASWFGEISAADSQDKLSSEFKSQNGDVSTYWDRWRTAVETVSSETSNFPKIHSSSPIVKIAQRKMKRIEEQVDQVIKNIQKTNTSADLGGIKTDFETAIGQIGGDTTIGSTRVALCGGGGSSFAQEGSHAGKILITDFLCLCAKSTSGKDKLCGPSMSSHTWGEDNAGTDNKGKESWAILKADCEKHGKRTLISPGEGRQALTEFIAAISKDSVTNGKNKIGALGTLHTNSAFTTGCTGKDNSNEGACLHYGDRRTDWDTKIIWAKNFKNGLEKLEKIHNTTVSIQTDISHLKALLTRAEEIYEETKINLESVQGDPERLTQNQSQKQNPTTPNDKATAQESITSSAATIPRFVLPWTLLI